MPGRFISFEGGEGAGKSTQIGLLAEFLSKRGRNVLLTREPGGTPGAEEIRKLLVSGDPNRWDALTEVLLINAARRDHWQRAIAPALEAGKWVLCDRFGDSTVAYQSFGRGLDRAMVEQVIGWASDGQKPDLTIIFDIAPEMGLERAHRRRGNEMRYEGFSPAFHARLREGYLAIARSEPTRCKVIDANRSIADIQHDVRHLVDALS